ncbi:transglutaminase-like putative cysteine protease [Aliiruegeria haliotis]|uniref:Transglutaminase-like putative cysteine protease n=1 Tax=Aliiruegeria haliotis TaxID=1280846 RepID=A0A2T0RKM3_9RHOB|nr:transglutaminase family protein [Aliiruegeria haliotis]PRY21745.1 transglutaminase-like putative cysteine protease [Aliiruegeria haliotis]
MLYDIRLTIGYSYPVPAVGGRHLLRLEPLERPGLQKCLTRRLTVTPEPVEWHHRRDFFGNDTVEITLASPHSECRFESVARVERHGSDRLLDVSPRPADLARYIGAARGLDPHSPHHFTGPSPRITPHVEMTHWARHATAGAATTLDTVRALGERIHEEFTFDPNATDVHTEALAAFRRREGVCQDFTHVMIACLRGVGIPAGYVSGFLRTVPPEGQPRLEGADAMHAWVRAWCGPQMGWVEYDPTNALQVSADHMVVACGRDYADVAPVRGVMRTSGEQVTRQSVDVLLVNEPDQPGSVPVIT